MPSTLGDGVWLNEPRSWREQNGRLEVTTDAASDFWRETHYGFTETVAIFWPLQPRVTSVLSFECVRATSNSMIKLA